MIYLAKLGELTLKKNNLKRFERQLAENLKYSLGKTAAKIRVAAGRMYVEAENDDEEAIRLALSNLLGITGFSRVECTEKSAEAIIEAALSEAKSASKEGRHTFKVNTRRVDKSFPLSGYELTCLVADEILSRLPEMKVDVHHPDTTIFIELRKSAYVYRDGETGLRGLPIGSGGEGLVLLSGGIDSPVAAFRMLSRGMKVSAIYFHSYPYTQQEALDKVETLAAILSRYALSLTLYVVSFTDVQIQIKKETPEKWSTMMLRAAMMECASLLAHEIGASALITGESLGQVASQTIANLAVSEHFSSLPLFRPLIGNEKEEIIKTARKIGTYETSILPYDDCCVLFSPRHPVLNPSVEQAAGIYSEINAAPFIEEALLKKGVVSFRNGAKITM